MHERVLIADDHPLFLKGLKGLLEENQIEVIAEAKDGASAFEMIKSFQPSVAILDLEMPSLSGLEVAKLCFEEKINVRIILLTFRKEKFIHQQAKGLNLYAYLQKDFKPEELIGCVKAALEGEVYLSKSGTWKEEKDLESIAPDLSPSEIRILQLIANGLSTKEIAEKLFIAERTVDKHRSNIINKLNIDKKHNSLLIWAQKNKDIIG